jgi:1,4-alpha-glucan branching enzyme
VRSFLISSGLFWANAYHVDGFRLDAVASMLYLDYSRKPGEWIPNEHGGNENLEAIDFLRRFNDEMHAAHPDVITVAEESTAWPLVSRPPYLGGLGFDMKWDMGWMHDTLSFFSNDPIHRSYHHGEITFRMIYAFHENYVLPLSHDEVVHGKGSLLAKMPGDDWQKLANLRLLLGYMYSQPGKKLLFMGGEIGQWAEWSHDRSLDWHLLEVPAHAALRRWVGDLNRVYRTHPALHSLDFQREGFQWLDANDAHRSTLSYIRSGPSPADRIVVVCNLTPVPRENFRVGVPEEGRWNELLNSDAAAYGGSNMGSMGGVEAAPVPMQGQPCMMHITLPPLAVVFFARQR